jgi:competence protein ComEC
VSEVLSTLYRAHAFAISFAGYALGVVATADGAVVWCTASIAALSIALATGARFGNCRRALAGAVFYSFTLGVVCSTLALRENAVVPFAPVAEHHLIADVIATDRPRATSNGESLRVRIVRVDAPAGADARSLEGSLALLDVPSINRPDRLVGKWLRVRARLSLPAGSRNEGEPAEKDILAEQGVDAILAAPAASDVSIGSRAPGWEAWWARLRLRCAQSVEARLPPLEATVLEGILWGDRGNLPATLRQEFSDTGTIHVLTTAGLHLGIFAGLMAWLLGRLPLPRPARVALVIAAAWCYAALAGLHLPTVRAATMLTAGAVAQESGRGRSPSAVLAAAAFAVVLPHPLALLSPSFAMSFSCVCGIALLSPALQAIGWRKGIGLPDFVVELARTSAAVQIAMWPMQALYFNAFTPYAVLANMIVVPLVGIVMALGGALVMATALIPVLAVPLSNLAWWSVAALVAAVQKFASLPNAHVDMPPPSHTFLVLYWVALAGFAWATRDTGRLTASMRWSAPVAIALALIYIAPGIKAVLDPRLHLDAIDVGQADCLLIRAPGMHAMLVDGGGKLERTAPHGAIVAQPLGDVIATRTVMPFLLRHWVLHLDAVVLTHPHGDHAGGLPVILSRERVDQVYDSAQLYGGPAYRRALDVVRGRYIPYLIARRGEVFDLGRSTHVSVLAPEVPLITGSSSDINNNSVVLRVDYGRVAMLLTGDAQSEAEARLLSHGGADLRAAVLKVGHHGSAYSSTPAFLAAVRPSIAIISCGLHNLFGHPSPRTLAALHAVGASIYRTDLDGGISIGTNGASIFARTSGDDEFKAVP